MEGWKETFAFVVPEPDVNESSDGWLRALPCVTLRGRVFRVLMTCPSWDVSAEELWVSGWTVETVFERKDQSGKVEYAEDNYRK